MTDTKLPEWPDSTPEIRLHAGFVRATPMERYERARADAAMARLRVAVKLLDTAAAALERSYDATEWPANGQSVQEKAALSVRRALAAIGPLPLPQKEGT